jgi:hypothetical protein
LIIRKAQPDKTAGMPNAGAAFYRPASLSAWSCGMFSKDKQRTLALGNRMLLQCAAPRE